MTGSQACLRSETTLLAPAHLAVAAVLALAPLAAGCETGAALAAADGASCEEALDRLFLLGAWTASATAAEDPGDAPTPAWFREAAVAALETCPATEQASVYACVADAADIAAMRRCVRPPEGLAERGRAGHGAAPGTDASFLARPRHLGASEALRTADGQALPPLGAVDPLAVATDPAALQPGVALAALGGFPIAAPAIAPGALPRPAGGERLAPMTARVTPTPAEPAPLTATGLAAAGEPAAPALEDGAGGAEPESEDGTIVPLSEAPSDRAVAVAVQSRRQAFHRCYAGLTQGLSSPPRVAYEVRLRLRGDGTVSDVDVASRRGDVPRLRACVQSVASRLSFDGRYRGEPDVRFPIIFSPGS